MISKNNLIKLNSEIKKWSTKRVVILLIDIKSNFYFLSFLQKIKRIKFPRSFLKELTKEPHLAASERDRELIKWIREQWTEFGLDSVSLSSYDFLFSYPDSSNPNKIYLLDENNQVVRRHQ